MSINSLAHTAANATNAAVVASRRGIAHRILGARRLLSATALGLGLAIATLGPSASAGAHEIIGSSFAFGQNEAAVAACMAQPNPYGPLDILRVVEDGMGDTLVWLEDGDGDYWACNANSEGAVFAYALVDEDLLEGQGVSMIQEVGTFSRNPLERAADLCVMVGGDEAELVSYVDDGLGDVLAWVEVGSELFMCNASTDGALFLFEAVDTPLNASEASLGLDGDAQQAGGLFPWQI